MTDPARLRATSPRMRAPWRRSVLLLVLFGVVLTCTRDYVGRRLRAPTLAVENLGALPVAVYELGEKMGTADPGYTCLRLNRISRGTTRLTFQRTSGAKVTSQPYDFWAHRGWSVTVNRAQRLDVHDLSTLQPDQRCR